MKKRYALLSLLTMLLISSAFGNVPRDMMVTETRAFGVVEAMDPAPTSTTNYSQRIAVLAEEIYYYGSSTPSQQRVRIQPSIVISSNNDWFASDWVAISLPVAQNVLQSIRFLEGIQSRLSRFQNADEANNARAELSINIVGSSNSDYLRTIERFWITPTDHNLPLMFATSSAIRRLPEGERAAAKLTLN